MQHRRDSKIQSLAVESKARPSEPIMVDPRKLRVKKLIHGLHHPVKVDFSEFCTCPQGSETDPFVDNWKVIMSLLLIRILNLFALPLKIFGDVLEFVMNFINLNGGPIRFTFRLLTGRLEIPRKNSEKFLSIIGLVERRQKLYEWESRVTHSENMDHPPQSPGDKFYIDLCCMASGLVYENENVIRTRVNDLWKMHFVKFYNFWNDRLEKLATQAFVCTDSELDANLILVSFRGTEPFNADDWATDADLSSFKIPCVGNVHMGFMEALGVANRFERNVKKNLDLCLDKADKPLAYCTLVSELKKLMKSHKTAKILVTGHSLGGALAVLFASVLVIKNEEEILERLLGVYTFGQPRVGNEEFGKNVDLKLNNPVPRYYRIVYCNDLVARVPFDNFIFGFKHFGTCLYYDSFYYQHNLPEAPIKNFSLFYMVANRLNALWEAIAYLFLPYFKGSDYKETWTFTVVRFTLGLLFPGVVSHFLVNYVHVVRLGPSRLQLP